MAKWLLGNMMMPYYHVLLRTFRGLRCTYVPSSVAQVLMVWAEFVDKETNRQTEILCIIVRYETFAIIC